MDKDTLENRLKTLKEGFSYVLYKELLSILKELNYSWDKNREILTEVFKLAKKDNAYYNYVLRKVIYEDIDNSYLEDVMEYMYIFSSLDYDEQKYIFKEILSICDIYFADIMKNSTYDQVVMRSLKKY